MLAVIEISNRQYLVKVGDVIKSDRLASDESLIDKVLLVRDASGVILGTPYVQSASVKIQVLESKRDDKILVFKKKRRKNYRRKYGHRQDISILKILNIEVKK